MDNGSVKTQQSSAFILRGVVLFRALNKQNLKFYVQFIYYKIRW